MSSSEYDEITEKSITYSSRLYYRVLRVWGIAVVSCYAIIYQFSFVNRT